MSDIPPPTNNGWNEWKHYVLAMLKEFKKTADASDARLQAMEKEMFQIKTYLKWGVIAIVVLLPVSNTAVRELISMFFNGVLK